MQRSPETENSHAQHGHYCVGSMHLEHLGKHALHPRQVTLLVESLRDNAVRHHYKEQFSPCQANERFPIHFYSFS